MPPIAVGDAQAAFDLELAKDELFE